MPAERDEVRLSPLLTATGEASQGLARVGGWIAIAFGALMLVWIGAAFAGMVTGGDADTTDTVVAVIALLFFAGMVVVGYRMATSARRNPRHRLLTAKHAFVITSRGLEFPEVPGRPAESWPLLATTTSATEGRLGCLVLRCEGFEPREYRQAHLADPVADVQRRIMAAQQRAHPDA